MKTVFQSQSEVCHIWANQSQSYGRAGSIYFESSYNNKFNFSNKIYSYGAHYLLAEFIDKDTVLINNRGYSSSTGNHINLIIGATSHFKQFFSSSCDLQLVYNSVKNNVQSLGNCRKPELYINPIFNLFESLNEFLKYTKTLTKVKRTKEYRYILKTVNSLKVDYKNLQEQTKIWQLKEEKRQLKLLKVDIQKFKKHEINYLWKRVGKFDYLRLSLDGLNVETSQSVKIPIAEAQRLLKLIDSKNITGAKVDNKFIVNSFNGLLKVGCHNIPLTEINYIRGLI